MNLPPQESITPKNPPKYSEFQRNQQGFITKNQQNFLMRQFIFQLFICILVGGMWTYAVIQDGPFFLGIFVICFFLIFIVRPTFIQGAELLSLPKPHLRIGTIRKSQYKTGYLAIMGDLRLTVSAKLWFGLKNGEQYEVYYTEKSKSLLSYKLVENDDRPASE